MGRCMILIRGSQEFSRSLSMSLPRFASVCMSSGFAALALVLGLCSQSAFAQSPQELETTMTRMLTAVQTGSVGDFVAQSDPSSKTAMLRQMQDVSDEIGSRLKQGYTATFWGKLNQGGLEVYVWKLEFKD